MSEDLREQNRNPLAHADGTQPRASAGTSDAPASGRRRHLLKAAASAGPLIATLPSGEALANASALQCVIKEQTSGDSPDPVIPASAADNYLRVLGQTRTYVVGVDPVTVYYIPTGANIIPEPPVPFSSSYEGATLYLTETGNWFDTDTGTENEDLREATLFLIQYHNTAEHPEASDITTNCDFDPDITAWNTTAGGPDGPTTTEHCFAPMAVKNVSSLGNFPLAHSCGTSFV